MKIQKVIRTYGNKERNPYRNTEQNKYTNSDNVMVGAPLPPASAPCHFSSIYNTHENTKIYAVLNSAV